MIELIKKFAGEFSVASIKKTRGMEGEGFTCFVVRGEKVIGDAADWGTGGGVMFHIKDKADHEALIAHAKSVLPDMPFEVDGVFIDMLVSYTDTIKKMKAKTASKIIAVDMVGSDKDEFGIPKSYTIINMANTIDNRREVMLKYPKLTVLNEQLESFQLLTVRKSKA